MAWVEVYGGQRSLAFELTTANDCCNLSTPPALSRSHYLQANALNSDKLNVQYSLPAW